MLIRHETQTDTVVDTNTLEVTEVVKVAEKQIGNSSDKPWLFKPGQSGNPNGRPKKGLALTDIMKEVLEETMPSGKTRKELLVRKVLEGAFNGNENLIRLAFNYVDGMPTQKQEITGKDGKDLPVPIMGVVTNVISGNNSDQKNSELTKTD